MEPLHNIKAELRELPPVTAEAVAAFRNEVPKLLYLVNGKFAVESTYSSEKPAHVNQDTLKNAHSHFADLLLAIYQFHLYDALVDQFLWFVATLKSRGARRHYFEQMLKAWMMAIHGTIEPSFSHELVQPLLVLERNIPAFYENAVISVEPSSRPLEKFQDFLLEKRRRDASDHILSMLHQGKGPEDLCSEFIIPVLQRVGILWQANKISVADEHAATEICRYIILRLFDSIRIDTPLPYTALVSCVPLEEHELGAEIVASYLESRGWTVYFLGHNVPITEVIAAITKHRPDVVFLSIRLVTNLPASVVLMQEIRNADPAVKIVVGGKAAVLAKASIGDYADAVIDDYKESGTIARSLF